MGYTNDDDDDDDDDDDEVCVFWGYSYLPLLTSTEVDGKAESMTFYYFYWCGELVDNEQQELQ